MNSSKEELERDFYTECCAYASSSRTVSEHEKRTYLLIEIVETPEELKCMHYIVDPGINPGGPKGQNLNMAQLVIVRSSNDIVAAVRNAANGVLEVHELSREVGMTMTEVMDIRSDCTNGEEFAAALMRKVLSND